MRLTTTIRYSLARLFLKSAGLSVISPWVRTAFLTPTFQRLTDDGYQRNSLVTACISVLTFTYSEPPLLVWSEEGSAGEPIPTHPVRKLLRTPNPLMGEDELWQYTIAYMAIGGNAYWACALNTRGQVVEIWPYHAGQIRPIPGGPSWIMGYEFLHADGEWKPINPSEHRIVHFKWPLPDLAQPWQAQPPLRSVAAAVDTDTELDSYLYALLKNDAVPPTIVKLPPDKTMPGDEKDRFRAKWMATFGGSNRGQVAILDDGADVQRLSLNLEELAFDALRRVPEARIAAAFRVPPILAGLNVGLEQSTYSNYEQARKAFTQDTLVPLWRAAAAEVQSAFAPELGLAVLRHDLNEVASLQEDVNAKWGRVNQAFASGYLGFKEARGALGLAADPPLDDVFLLGMSATLEPAAVLLGMTPRVTVVQQAPPQLTDATEQRGRGAPSFVKARPAQVARALQRIRASVARRMEAAVARYFEELAGRVVGRLRKSKGRDTKATAADLLPASEGNALALLFRTWTIELCAASWETWNAALDMDLAFEETDPAVVAALEQSGTRVKDITEATRSFLARVLSEGAAAGLTIDELADGVRLVIEEGYKNRARAIARTETGYAQQATAIARFEGAAIASILVLDGGGDDETDACDALNGTTQSIAWAKANMLGHPNCVRCFAPVPGAD